MRKLAASSNSVSLITFVDVRDRPSKWKRAGAIAITVYAVVQIVFLAFLWINHLPFPLNLEAMEHTVLQHVVRAQAGLPIYVEPTAAFVPLAYNPLYYYLSVPFAWVFGASVQTLRLVAGLGMFGAILVVFLAVRKVSGRWWGGLIAAGLFAAAYRGMDTYLDNAFPDSWMLFTALLGCYLVDRSESLARNYLGVLLTLSAFWFKQPGAAFTAGVILYATWRIGWRKMLPMWLVVVFLGPVLYLAAPDWLFGPRLHYFTQEVPRHWIQFDLRNILRVMVLFFRYYPVLLVLGIGTSVLDRLRQRRQTSIWYFILPFAGLTTFAGLIDPESANNLYIPIGTIFIITGVLGLAQLTEYLRRSGRRDLHLVLLAISFIVLLYNPMSVIVPPQAYQAYQDLVSRLRTLGGTIYAPWIGYFQGDFELYPSAHWVPMDDMIRGSQNDGGNTTVRQLLEEVANPKRDAFILMPYPLEADPLLGFLAEKYALITDFGDHFASLTAIPKRFTIGGPRYLYRYAPETKGH